MKFHKREIPKGEYGQLSKIKEELEEAIDAAEDGNPVLMLLELSDMIGAVEGYLKPYGLTVEDLLVHARLRSSIIEWEEENGFIYKRVKREDVCE